MILYDYQEKGVKEIQDNFRLGYRTGIYCLPTGGGKTAVMGKIAELAVAKNSRVLIITDRQELLDGSAKALTAFKVYPHLITAKTKSLNPSHYAYVAMSQTLKRRIQDSAYFNWVSTAFDIIMIDECHKEEFNVFFEKQVFGGARVIGFTATPRRTGKSRQLAQDYGFIVFGPSVQELISMGRLAMPNYITPNLDLDWSNIRTSRISGEEDYREEDVARVMDSDYVYSNVVESYQKHTPNTMAIVFCPDAKTTIKTCKKFNDAGITAKYLISDPKEAVGAALHQEYKSKYTYERKRLLRDYSEGKFLVMVNNGILTTGYDNPKIRTVIIEKRTQSDNLLQQIIGRGSRVIKGEKDEFNIIDMADNFERLDKWHHPRVYSLHHKKNPPSKPPLKTCPSCGWKCFASTKICDNIVRETGLRCNFVFPTKEKVYVDVEMKVTSYRQLKYNEIKQLCKTSSFDEIEKMKSERGYLESWVYMIARDLGRLEEYEMHRERMYARASKG